MLIEGAWLMVIGMTAVFVFLALLVGLMNLSAVVLARWPDDDSTGDGEDARRIAVAIAAAQRMRERA